MPKRQSAQQQKSQPEAIAYDRRRKRRYPIGLQLEYKIVKNYLVIGSGTGTSIDLSSSGIAFVTDQPLKVGSYLELSANWPVLLNNSCPLKLVIYGKVIRSDERVTAVAANRHEFRTRKADGFQTPGVPTAIAIGFH